MARQSAASLSVVPIAPQVRMPPPDELSDGEKTIWLDVINSKPVDWFAPDSAPLLREYVRAVVMCDRLAEMIDVAMSVSEGDPPDKLMKLRDMESKRVLSTGTKMRLTQQSRYTPMASSTANKKAGQAQPWQKAS